MNAGLITAIVFVVLLVVIAVAVGIYFLVIKPAKKSKNGIVEVDTKSGLVKLNRDDRMLNLAWSNNGKHKDTKDDSQRVVHLDGFDAKSDDIAQYKSQNRVVTAYMSIGSVENWRPDAKEFPKECIGKDYDKWAGEKWLLITHVDKFKPIMIKRLQLFKNKGFMGVEFDNTEMYKHDPAYQNDNTAVQNKCVAFLKDMARECHTLGLLVFWKNCVDIIPQIVDAFDGVINESALRYKEYKNLMLFMNKNKPCWVFEYVPIEVKPLPAVTDVYLDSSKGWVSQLK
jgi:hypothetical protein